MSKTFQVVGIGNAMVDVLSHTEDAFLEENGVQKGIMQLIDVDRASELYAKVGPATEISGGSNANAIAGVAQLGGRTAYVGKVKDDQLGAIFAHDLRAQGAHYETAFAPRDADGETGRCIVLVTPDGERSMNTYLGVTETLGPEDIDEGLMADTDWIYLEGYRFDGPQSHAAFAKAIAACEAGGGRVALTLSDPFCVDRHREAFMAMIRDHVDLLFCNRAEVCAMYPAESFERSMELAAAEVETLACTDSEHGAHIWSSGQRWHARANAVEQVVDATGAGDLFAGAFLWAIAEGHDWPTAGRMGCVAAAEIISHIGARPEQDLRALFGAEGLL